MGALGNTSEWACQAHVGGFVCQAVVYLGPPHLTEAGTERRTIELRPDAGPCLNRLPPESEEDMAIGTIRELFGFWPDSSFGPDGYLPDSEEE
jgi:hypothetical protein